MEEIIRLPFNILEKELFKEYLKERIEDGYILKEIIQIKNKVKKIEIYDAVFIKGENKKGSYRLLYFEPDDDWESTEKSKAEEVRRWIAQNEGEDCHYISKWYDYYIFLNKQVLDEEEITPLIGKDKKEKTYIRNKCCKQYLNNLGTALLYIFIGISNLFVLPINRLWQSNTTVIAALLAIILMIPCLRGIGQWLHYIGVEKKGIKVKRLIK